MATTLVSVDEYLRSDYEPDMDFVDGVLEERNLGEFDHSDLQAELVRWIRNHWQPLGITAFPELRTQITPTRFRVPDIVIVAGKRPRHGVLRVAPLVAVEILSPEDRLSRVQKRIDDFLSIGTRYVWVIDPAEKRAWVHTAQGSFEAKDGILRIDSPALEIPLTKIFADLEQNIED